MIAPDKPPRSLQLTVSWTTLLKLLAFAAVVFLGVKLLPLFGLLLLGLLIAITLEPIAQAIWKRGGAKWLGILVCALMVFGSLALFFFFIGPVAAAQIGGLIKELPTIKDHILQHLPKEGSVHDLAEGVLKSPAFSNPAPLLEKFMSWGMIAVEGFVELFIVLIVAIYLVADGRRVWEWLIAFLPERQCARVNTAAREISGVVFSYMGGQLITSVLCALYVWGVLVLLHVPNAVLLALAAGVFDVLPLIGFFCSLAPSLAMAATVSPPTALYVAALYTVYHLAENYLIVPAVYGNRLRLSTLTVFISCLAAGSVAGVVGVIIILPLVASYPIIERIWLRPVVGADTVDRHDEIEEEEHPTK